MCSENSKVLLGIAIDNKLAFDSHVKKCKKSGQIAYALSRILIFLNNDQNKMIFNTMIKSRFCYCT